MHKYISFKLKFSLGKINGSIVINLRFFPKLRTTLTKIKHSDESVWNWDLLREDHKQDLEWAIYMLTQRQQYTFKYDFSLEGIKGTIVEITSIN